MLKLVSALVLAVAVPAAFIWMPREYLPANNPQWGAWEPFITVFIVLTWWISVITLVKAIWRGLKRVLPNAEPELLPPAPPSPVTAASLAIWAAWIVLQAGIVIASVRIEAEGARFHHTEPQPGAAIFIGVIFAFITTLGIVVAREQWLLWSRRVRAWRNRRQALEGDIITIKSPRRQAALSD